MPVNTITRECRGSRGVNNEDVVKVEGEICNRTENGYGTGIGYGYCTIRTAGINQGTEVRNICSRSNIVIILYHENRINTLCLITNAI